MTDSRRRLRHPTLFAVVFSAFAWCAGATLRADLPKPAGAINDFAAVLDEAAERELTQLVTALESDTTAEIAVATVTSLDGLTMEDYAEKLFAAWGVGQRGKDNGVLVIVAPAERTMRIEVGYGLEPILPDGLAGAIIREEFVPAFRADDYQAGVLAGVRRIADIIRRNEPVTEEARRAFDTSDQPRVIVAPPWFILPFFAIFVAAGSYMLGTGAGAQIAAMVIVGGLVAASGLVMSSFVAWWALAAQLALAAWIVRAGFRKASAPDQRAKLRGRTKRTGWVVGASGSSSGSSRSSSSGSSGSSFGGGRSGGGGATGRW